MTSSWREHRQSKFHFFHVWSLTHLLAFSIEASKLSHWIFFRCYHEHVDMFTEVRSKTDQLALVETPFGGRYCGKIPPRQRISLYKTMVFIFLSDRDNVTAARFSGTFSFIPDGNGVIFQVCWSTYLGCLTLTAKLAIVSAVSGDFLSVSVAPISGEKWGGSARSLRPLKWP